MKRLAATTLALLCVSLQAAPSQNGASAETGSQPLERPLYGDLVELFEQRARAHPELMEIETLTQSDGGRPFFVAVLGDRDLGRAATRPGLIVCTGGTSERATLELCRTLLDGILPQTEGQGAQGLAHEQRARLARATIYLLPVLQPDRFGSQPVSPGELAPIDLDRNFPNGWRPAASPDGGAGPYPLSEPESRALADFLARRTNLSTMLFQRSGARFAAEDGAASTQASLESAGSDDLSLSSSDRGVYRRVARSTAVSAGAVGGLHPLPQLVRRAGGLAEFCDAYHGLFAFALDPTVVRGSEGSGTWLLAVRALADRLPRIEVGEPELTALRASVAQVDFSLHNRGDLPTHRARGWRKDGGLRLRVQGVKLHAVGLRDGSVGSFELGRVDPRIGDLGHLEAGQELFVRLVVGADPGTRLDVGLESTRVGSARFALLFPPP